MVVVGAFMREYQALIEGPLVAEEAVRRVLSRVVARANGREQTLEEVLYESVYREEHRLSRPGAHSAADVSFVKSVRHDLARADEDSRQRLLHRLLTHYGHEIAGHFDPRVYRFATSVLPAALAALLHGGRPSPRLFQVDDRVLLEGDVAGLQRAARQGTVMLVPTHFSHLDSLLLGHAIFRLGLPPFAYGAGLNLFSSSVTGYFMRNLGAFTVDREKSDPLYRETMKEYATVLLERGQHMLFFPGGTRSRSGGVESHLKLGLLGTAVRAFENLCAQDPHSPPMFIVPCSLSYPLVLEAQSLIAQYLDAEGGAHFVDVKDEFERPASWLGFLGGLAELDLQVHVRFGSPLDPFGNAVDDTGRSIDPGGRPLDPARYLLVDGKVSRDEARDAEFTSILGARVLNAFGRATVALPSSVLAFAVFACLRRRYPELDVFRFLRMLAAPTHVPVSELEPQIDAVLAALAELHARGEIALDSGLTRGGRAWVLEKGAATLSAYHRPPVLVRRGKNMEVVDASLLLYYKTRLDGFGLPGELRGTGRSIPPTAWSAR